MESVTYLIIIVILLAMLAYAGHLLFSHPRASSCPPCPTRVHVVGPHTPMTDIVTTRDQAVMQDPLYPPVSRDTRDNTIRLMQEPRLQPTRDSSDTFQLIGYLINSTNKEDVWKLVARTYNRSRAEFYADSSNKNIDVKVPLTPDTARTPNGTRAFTDIYDLPDTVVISHPMFDQTSLYNVVQLPRSQLASGYW